MKRNFIGGLLLCGLTCTAVAQSEYEAGFARVSIEPDESLFSLPLAGYGYPREGRFTLEWTREERGMEIVEMSGNSSCIYALNVNGCLMKQEIKVKEKKWKTERRQAGDLRLLAIGEKEWFGLDSAGNLWKGRPEHFLRYRKKIGVMENVAALTAAEGRLYAACGEGGLWEGCFTGNRMEWKKIGEAGGIVSLAAYGGRFYALTEDGILWQRLPGAGKPWLKIAWTNGFTCPVRMKRIAIAGGRLYGLSEEDIVYKAGHSSLHRLSASALAVRSGKQTVVMVGVDLTGFDYSLGVEVKREIALRRGIPAEAILINASHTHFAPVAQAFPTWGEHQQLPDSLYLNRFVKEGMIRAVEQALDHMEKSRLFFGRGTTAIGANRSLSGKEVLYDPTLDVIRIQGKKHEGIVFFTGCHPVFRNEGLLGYTISPNFPGYARRRIEEKSGAEMAIFLQGCAGDINPREGNPVLTGLTLGEDVLRVMKEKMIPLSGKITCKLDSVLLPARVWSEERIRQFREENSGQEGDVEAEKNVRWADRMLALYAHGKIPRYMPVYVQLVRIGNWSLVGLSREAVTEYGTAVRALQPNRLVSVAGYCNDVPSYLPTPEHIRAGTYEGYNSFFWNAQPALFPEKVFEAVLEKVKEKLNK